MKIHQRTINFLTLIFILLAPLKEGTSQNPCNPFEVNTPLGTTINDFDWTTEFFDMYLNVDDQPGYRSIASPFYSIAENDNIEVLVEQPIPNKDFYPEDGWEVVKVDFGTPTQFVVTPGFILYNLYESVLRVFHYITQGGAGATGESFNKAAIILSFDNHESKNSAALNYISMPAKALDNFGKNVKGLVPNVYNNGGSWWLWADFPIAYDPCTCNHFTKLQSMPHLYKITQIDLKMEGGGIISPIVENSSS